MPRELDQISIWRNGYNMNNRHIFGIQNIIATCHTNTSSKFKKIINNVGYQLRSYIINYTFKSSSSSYLQLSAKWVWEERTHIVHSRTVGWRRHAIKSASRALADREYKIQNSSSQRAQLLNKAGSQVALGAAFRDECWGGNGLENRALCCWSLYYMRFRNNAPHQRSQCALCPQCVFKRSLKIDTRERTKCELATKQIATPALERTTHVANNALWLTFDCCVSLLALFYDIKNN